MAHTEKDITLIVAEALEKSTAEARTVYLDRVCGDDASLREEVESLLQIENRLGDFLETTVDDLDVTLLDHTLGDGI